MSVIYCPLCGSSDIEQIGRAWKWRCPGCLELLVIVPIPTVQAGITILPEAEDIPELDFIQVLLDDGRFINDNGGSL